MLSEDNVPMYTSMPARRPAPGQGVGMGQRPGMPQRSGGNMHPGMLRALMLRKFLGNGQFNPGRPTIQPYPQPRPMGPMQGGWPTPGNTGY